MKVQIILIALAVAPIAACSSSTTGSPSKPTTLAVHGTVTVTDPVGTYPVDDSGYDADTPWGTGGYASGQPCETLSGYQDVMPGASVVIADDGGKTLALTKLGSGVYDNDGGCVFAFDTSVPAGRGFYGVTVSNRGTVKEPESDMGALALTLG